MPPSFPSGPTAPRDLAPQHPYGPSAGARGRRQAPAATAALGLLEGSRRPPRPRRGQVGGTPTGQGDLDDDGGLPEGAGESGNTAAPLGSWESGWIVPL